LVKFLIRPLTCDKENIRVILSLRSCRFSYSLVWISYQSQAEGKFEIFASISLILFFRRKFREEKKFRIGNTSFWKSKLKTIVKRVNKPVTLTSSILVNLWTPLLQISPSSLRSPLHQHVQFHCLTVRSFRSTIRYQT